MKYFTFPLIGFFLVIVTYELRLPAQSPGSVKSSCISNTLFTKTGNGEIEKYEATYAVEGYQEIITLYPDSVFSYQLVTRLGHHFSSGKWKKVDSLLYLHSDPMNYRKIFKREKRNTARRRHLRIELAQVYVILADGICLHKHIK